jgi:murein L,D-transpeptidase YcbB/YkuD
MRKRPAFAILAAGLLAAAPRPGAFELFGRGTPAPMEAALTRKLAALDSSGRLRLSGEVVFLSKDLAAFYGGRSGKPAWFHRGTPVPAAWQLYDAVRKCDLEGLEASDYHIRPLDSLLRRFNRKAYWHRRWEPEAGADLDLMLTDAFLRLSRHLLMGRVKFKIPQDDWHIGRERMDFPAYLEQTLRERRDARDALQRLTPPQPEYGRMKYWLGEYLRIAERGGWPKVSDGAPLGPGSDGPRVAELCRRLRAGHELAAASCSEIFTPDLEAALRRFQGSHGLDTTGIADARTLKQLNVGVRERIDQIELNLECWRWLPQDLGERHIRVNIADYRLGAYQGGEEVFSMKVVVGRKEDSTPVFSDRMTLVQLNPSWNVPATIAGEEMLPELIKDPEYLAKHDMEALSDWSESAVPVQPDTVDWSEVEPEKFPFRIRQKNGDASALGRIKFVLTNPFNIYLHDTPAKKYFERDKRALSHGCVRLADPLKLAVWALGQDPRDSQGSVWTRERIEADIAKGKETFIPLPGKGIPVHILYWTCFVDPEGGLQFRSDVYGWNRQMEKALDRKAATF